MKYKLWLKRTRRENRALKAEIEQLKGDLIFINQALVRSSTALFHADERLYKETGRRMFDPFGGLGEPEVRG